MIAERRPAAAGFHTDHLDLLILNEVIEQAYGVAAASHTRDEKIGQPPFFF